MISASAKSKGSDCVLQIIDKDKVCTKLADKIVYWSGYSNFAENSISILDLVEKNSNALKEEYLRCVFEVSSLKINNRSIYEKLNIDSGFSFWSMTLVEEKCNTVKSVEINQVIKFLQLEKLIESLEVSAIILSSEDRFLCSYLTEYCKNNDIKIVWSVAKKKQGSNFGLITLQIFSSLFFLLKFVFKNFFLIIKNNRLYKSNNKEVTIINYLDNFDVNETNSLKSDYWGELPNLLLKLGLKINWIHFYIRGSIFKKPKDAENYLNDLNGQKNAKCSHYLIESFASFGTMFYALQKWIKFSIYGFEILKAIRKSNFSPAIKQLFTRDLIRSIYGSVAIFNLINYYSFKNLFGGLEKQSFGLYLYEGQSWESGFISAWRECSNGLLIGVPHSNIRFWDLRFFSESKKSSQIINNKPLADIYAVNGRAALELLSVKNPGLPKIYLVESLRYQHLNNIIPSRIHKNISQAKDLKILVLGDFSLDKTLILLNLVLDSSKKIPNISLSVIYKPHPNCPNINNVEKNFSLFVSKEKIGLIVSDADIVIASSYTTASIEACLHGKPLICVMDNNIMNMSPLRGIAGIFFVASVDEMVNAINKFIMSGQFTVECDPDWFFCLDSNLKRWENLLSLINNDAT